jgi:hypothetical protein
MSAVVIRFKGSRELSAIVLKAPRSGMKVEDYFVQARRGWVRLHETGQQGP